ncbi:MAG: hypothetical protein HQK49_12390 [Oligoflexia bacterium]|nr:hypothetical protein [Oligoflexia bacterium]
MSKDKLSLQNQKNQKNKNEQENRQVLYQKIGEKWYVFAETEDDNEEIIFAPIPMGIDPKKTKFDLYQVIDEKESSKESSKERSKRSRPSEKLEADSL